MHHINLDKLETWQGNINLVENLDMMLTKTPKEILTTVIDEFSTTTANKVIDVILKIAFKWTLDSEINTQLNKRNLIQEYGDKAEKQEKIQKAFDECGGLAENRLKEIGTSVRKPGDTMPVAKFLQSLSGDETLELNEQMTLAFSSERAKELGYSEQDLIKNAKNLRKYDILKAWEIEAASRFQQNIPGWNTFDLALVAKNTDVALMYRIEYKVVMISEINDTRSLPTFLDYSNSKSWEWYQIKSYNEYKTWFNGLSPYEKYWRWYGAFSIKGITHPYSSKMDGNRYWTMRDLALEYRKIFFEDMEKGLTTFREDGKDIAVIYNQEENNGRNGSFEGLKPLSMYAIQFLENHKDDSETQIQDRKIILESTEKEELIRLKDNYKINYLGAEQTQNYDAFMREFIDQIEEASKVSINGLLHHPESLRFAASSDMYRILVRGSGDLELFNNAGIPHPDIKFILHYTSPLGITVETELPRRVKEKDEDGKIKTPDDATYVGNLSLRFISPNPITLQTYLEGKDAQLANITTMLIKLEEFDIQVDGETFAKIQINEDLEYHVISYLDVDPLKRRNNSSDDFKLKIIRNGLDLHPTNLKFSEFIIGETSETDDFNTFQNNMQDKIHGNTLAMAGMARAASKISEHLIFKDSLKFVKGIDAVLDDRDHGGDPADLVNGFKDGNVQQLKLFIQQEFWGSGNFPIFLTNISEGKIGQFSEVLLIGGQGAAAAALSAKSAIIAIQAKGLSGAITSKLASIKAAVIVNKTFFMKASATTIIKSGMTGLLKVGLSVGKLVVAIAILAAVLTAVVYTLEYLDKLAKNKLCKLGLDAEVAAVNYAAEHISKPAATQSIVSAACAIQ